MMHLPNRLRSVFILQIIIIHTSSGFPPVAKRSSQNATFNMKNFLQKQTFCKQIECNRYKQQSIKQDAFYRNTRSIDIPRMLAIDLSQLHPSSTKVTTGSRHKPPVNLLGVDISALSQNPAPHLPIVSPTFDITQDGKIIREDNFDPRYDRLPRLGKYHMNNYLPHMSTDIRIPLLYPFQHLPLNIMTTYHLVTMNKKQGDNFKTDQLQKGNDSQKKYAINFILYLLHQLSSNHDEDLNQ